MTTSQELTQDVKGPFEVVSYEGEAIGKKTWLLRQTTSGQIFAVTQNTTSSWPKSRKPQGGPCIILSVEGASMVGMHLATGLVFSDKSPPTALNHEAF